VIPLASEQDGNSLHTAVIESHHDSTGAAEFKPSVITNVAGPV
jgi:hypothetical protein